MLRILGRRLDHTIGLRNAAFSVARISFGPDVLRPVAPDQGDEIRSEARIASSADMGEGPDQPYAPPTLSEARERERILSQQTMESDVPTNPDAALLKEASHDWHAWIKVQHALGHYPTGQSSG
jgi:hypothetical protein